MSAVAGETPEDLCLIPPEGWPSQKVQVDAEGGGGWGGTKVDRPPPSLHALRHLKEPEGLYRLHNFELLFGRWPRGLLDVEVWEEQPSPFRFLVKFVQEMQEWINRVKPIVQEHMEATQWEGLQLAGPALGFPTRQPGAPSTLKHSWKFLARWQGPYTVLEKADPVKYCLQQPGKCTNTQIYNINLFKKWIQPAPVVSAFSTVSPGPPEHALVQWGENLSPAQKQELIELVDQIAGIFSTVPGLTHLV